LLTVPFGGSPHDTFAAALRRFAMDAAAGKSAKTKQPKKDKQTGGATGGSAGGDGSKKVLKKQTGLALSVTKEEDFTEWYTQTIVLSEMIEYYDVSGCYILRPWAFRYVHVECVVWRDLQWQWLA
jgi:hypothetical protein